MSKQTEWFIYKEHFYVVRNVEYRESRNLGSGRGSYHGPIFSDRFLNFFLSCPSNKFYKHKDKVNK